MASSYNIAREGQVLKVGFGPQAENTQIVQDALARLNEMDIAGEFSSGGLLKIDGPASLPVAMVLCHALAHRFAAIAVMDPKMKGFVVAVTHDPQWKVGDFIPL